MIDRQFNIDLILEELLQCEEGELATYSQLSALTGLDVQFEHRSILDDALREAYDNYDIVFRNTRNIGYRRLTDTAVIDELRSPGRIKRETIRGRRDLTKVKFDELDPVYKSRQQANFAMLAAADYLASGEHFISHHSVDVLSAVSA